MSGTSQGLDTVIGGDSTSSPNEALEQARQLEADGNRIGAIEALRGASASGDERVLFRLAWLLDRVYRGGILQSGLRLRRGTRQQQRQSDSDNPA